MLRVVRFLKLGRYSPAMRSLLDALYAERRALLGCFMILIGAALVMATLMYLAEGKAQPDKFGTIPDAMWWAIVTLGTIGYGDVVPVTPFGRILATGTIFLGLIMVALPVGIVAQAFANDIHRREFIVTWGMVARVPLFAGLDANQIAEIMRLLRSQRIEAGTIIARRGEPAHSMYFVAAGEVEIDLPDRCVRLGAGHFFGEIAVLRKARRSATVRAVTRTSLLVLDARDVHILMDHEPRIAERIHETARQRIEPETLEPRGDLAAEELVASDDNAEGASALRRARPAHPASRTRAPAVPYAAVQQAEASHAGFNNSLLASLDRGGGVVERTAKAVVAVAPWRSRHHQRHSLAPGRHRDGRGNARAGQGHHGHAAGRSPGLGHARRARSLDRRRGAARSLPTDLRSPRRRTRPRCASAISCSRRQLWRRAARGFGTVGLCRRGLAQHARRRHRHVPAARSAPQSGVRRRRAGRHAQATCSAWR